MRRHTWTTPAIAATILSTPLAAGTPHFKMYEVRSGKITYTIRSDSKMMKVRGKKRRIFDQYGYRELVEEARVQTMNVFGQTQKDKTHTLDLRVGTQVTHADFGQKTLTRMPTMALSALIAGANQNMTKLGEKMLRKMGGRKIGTEKVAGYTCDVWQTPLVTQCLYHGVPLKIVSGTARLKETEIATEAKFDIAVKESSFKLPAFKEQRLPPQLSEMFGGHTEASGGSGADLGALLQQAAQNAPTDQRTQAEDDPLGGLGSALGSVALTQIKQQIGPQLKALKFARSCIAHARTLRSANRCVDRAAAVTGEPGEHFDHWDAAARDKALREIDTAQKYMECGQKAQSLEQLQQCK